MSDAAETVRADGTLQVVMLRIGSETFALDAGMVREIIDPIPATHVAGARAHLDRIVNVRGNVVPLADIRERFGMKPAVTTPDTRFVVIEVVIDGDPVVVALVADRVFEVTEIHLDQKQPVPKIGASWRPEYIRFIVKRDDDFVIVPDVEQILI
ncbi:chemotaxis protein CheW [Methylobacterium symbioticum]|uniref:Chemotaxis protein CheW n=1 Tax=Methylobacterium symbioticum TaxID=2584084 RepID=A0A509EK91_9HYPH|nr:chemotaxis protein CheW [Methylobacterium symbioticum]VUD73633.1 Chemotaxis protein CheW [Methylobacterium symbioticum]